MWELCVRWNAIQDALCLLVLCETYWWSVHKHGRAKKIFCFAFPPAPHFRISWENFLLVHFFYFDVFCCLNRVLLILFSHITPFTHFSTIKWGIPSYGYHDKMFLLSWMSRSENILEICLELSGFSIQKNKK